MINPSLPSHPTPETHPKIKFWTFDDFNNWLSEPSAQYARRGKEAYLEEETGELVSDSRLTSIRECIRGAWCELVNMKRAPQVWGELDATGREFFHTYMEKTWPLFRCAEGGWKLDRIARTSYPAW